MLDRRKTPRPDRLFVDSTITGDVEVVTLSTKPGDLDPPITYSAGPRPGEISERDIWETSGVLDANAIEWPVARDFVPLGGVAYRDDGAAEPRLFPAEELQREAESFSPPFTKTELTLWGISGVIAFVALAALFWPAITRSPLA